MKKIANITLLIFIMAGCAAVNTGAKYRDCNIPFLSEGKSRIFFLHEWVSTAGRYVPVKLMAFKSWHLTPDRFIFMIFCRGSI
mgnify:CR=1 FL=1